MTDAPKFGEWQDISTAPKDGTTIFGASWRLGQRGMIHFNGDEWEMVNGLTNFPAGIGFNPTHWCPLPPSPKALFISPTDRENLNQPTQD